MGFEALDPFRSHGDQAIVLDNSVAMRWLVASTHAEHQRFALNVREHIAARVFFTPGADFQIATRRMLTEPAGAACAGLRG